MEDIDPNVVIAIVGLLGTAITLYFTHKASGKVQADPPPTAKVEPTPQEGAESLAWHIARTTMEQQRERIIHLEARCRRLEEQLRAHGHTPNE